MYWKCETIKLELKKYVSEAGMTQRSLKSECSRCYIKYSQMPLILI